MKKKILVACLCVALAVLTIAGTTLAYLTAKTAEVKNTFTIGKVSMDLWETADGKHTDTKLNDKDYIVKTRNDMFIVPGEDVAKDPTVTITANSENSWVFIQVKEENWPDMKETDGTRKVNYTIDSTVWTQLTVNGVDVSGVYFKSYTKTATDVNYNVLKDMEVTVSGTLTMDDIAKISSDDAPTLTFYGYAIQQAGFESAADAWTKEVSKLAATTNP